MLSHGFRPTTSNLFVRSHLRTRILSALAAIERNPVVQNPALVLGPRYFSMKAPEARFFNNVYQFVSQRILLARRAPSGSRKQVPNSSRHAPKKETEKSAKNPSSESEGSKGTSGGPPEDNRQDILNRLKMVFVISLAIYGLMIMLVPRSDNTPGVTDTNWTDFTTKLLPSGQISKIIVYPEKEVAFIYMFSGAKSSSGEVLEPLYRLGIPSVGMFEDHVYITEAQLNIPPEHHTPIEYKNLDGVASIVTLVALAGFLLAGYFIFKRVKVSFKVKDIMSSMTNTKIRVIDPLAKDSQLKIKFKDVAGLHEAKVEINEFVDYLKHPAKYAKYGAKLPKGAILTGPPGCGKTLLAKALAAESSCPFIVMNGTEFVEIMGGVGASRIRQLFKEAKSRAPCIIYIDEIDAIGRKRNAQEASMSGGSSEEEHTLNQLLVEMDGIDSNQGVIVIASTNRPDILDKALLRRGRFDRHISIDLPTVLERQEVFDIYLRQIKLSGSYEHLSKRLAQMTPGFSGADIANVVNEAAIHAATNRHKVVDVSDLSFAMDRILAGPEKRSKTLIQEEREIVAYHESGHALVGWLLEHTDALLKVTIIPRTSAALGFAQYNPRDRKLFTKEENYGMSSVVGPLSFSASPGEERSSQFTKKPYGGQLAQIIDQEAGSLVSKAYFATEELIRKNRDKLETLAKALLDKETLTYEQVKQLIGPPTYGDKNVVDVAEHVLPPVEPENE
ncbi:hypothetical protein FO519_003266 [Halicephalobus sp. NKZ332]|nr:hypothetical protein FO519_003266 [Halicephalobus sp. NKZ332]